MNRTNQLVATTAYGLALLSPLSILWIPLAGYDWAHHKGLWFQNAVYGPGLTAAASVMLGAACAADSRFRHGRCPSSNYAKAATVIGIASGLCILWVSDYCIQNHYWHNFQSRCLSNVKQINIALSMYAQDYDEKYPPSMNWADGTLPYIKNIAVYHCPAEDDQSQISYGYNQNLAGLELARIAEPALTIDLIDAKPGTNRAVGIQEYPFTIRHDNYLIADYVDGHTKRLKSAEVLTQVWEPKAATKKGKTSGVGK